LHTAAKLHLIVHIISRNAIMPVVGGGGVEIVDDCHVDDQKFSCAAPAK
jgi:hypothetical protein